jgi:alpha-ketoglutaric semialdehyde dehydrogenase
MKTPQHKNYIAGEWIGADAVRLNIYPSDINAVIGEYAQTTVEQTQHAIDAAFAAQRRWAVWSAEQRADALDRIGSEILLNSEELGYLLSREYPRTQEATAT